MDKFLRTTFNGDSNLGLYGFATDAYCLVGVNAKLGVLDVPVYHVPLMNIDFSGIFVTGNSIGVVIPKAVKDYGTELLKKHIRKTLALKTDYSALGNLMLINDNGVMISPIIKKHRKEIEQFFGIPCVVGTIARQKIIGNLGMATNAGCLLHPKAKKDEIRLIQETLGVQCHIGTVNFGSPYPGAGIIANSNGCVVGETSSGPELGRIAEALGFV